MPPTSAASLSRFSLPARRYESYANLIRITFSEAAPLTGEHYGLTVWSQPYLDAPAARLDEWTNLEWGTTVNSDGKREMIIDTYDNGAMWLPPGGEQRGWPQG